MKKMIKKIHITRLAVILTLIPALLAALAVPAAALESQYTRWPTFSSDSSDNYVARGFVRFAEWPETCQFSGDPLLTEIKAPAGADASSLTPTAFTAVNNINGVFVDSGTLLKDTSSRGRVEPVTPGPADYTKVQYWRFYDATNGRSFVGPVALVEDSTGQEATVDKLEAYTARAEKLRALMKEYDRVFDILAASQNAAAVKAGAYQPSDINLICKAANRIQQQFDFTIRWPDTHDFWVEGEGWETATVDDMVTHWTTYYSTYYPTGSPDDIVCKPGDKLTPARLEYLDLLLDVIGPYWLNYVEQDRISAPDIGSFSIGSSRGVVDAANKTVTIRMPAGTDWDSVQPVIKPAGQAKIAPFAGSFASGIRLYNVTPGNYATGIYYNGDSEADYVYGVDLSAIWQVKVETGDPYNYAVSFAVKTADGKTRYGTVTEGEGGTDGAITLNLPVGTNLSALTPIVDYAGEGYRFTVDGYDTESLTDIDFTKPVTLTVYNTEFGLSTGYDVTITADPSAENDILSYKLGGISGVVSGNTVSVTIPYDANLAALAPEIAVSEFASVTTSPAALVVGDNSYVVTAENGGTKSYTVTVIRTPISAARNILSFKYGGYTATINQSAGTISLTVPKGSVTTFAPVIEVSEFATVSPASGVVQNFSSPVQYRVTAQNGSTKTYTVTVTVSGEAAPNPYQAQMSGLLGNIIYRYSTSAGDDWEWMNLGIRENVLANYNAGMGHPFDPAKPIAKLRTSVTSGVIMTDIDRTIMMLTARGFDCSNLAQYNGGAPYLDSDGVPVDNFVATIYNYPGGYTINGPTFALIALDMGNYSIPSNAVWTREKLLDKLLAHTYLSDNFGLDMVGMIMYAIAPYQDDAVYGERVRAKLDEGLDIILDKMEDDFTFGAWNVINSETAAQVICGITSMGIDCHTDPRLSDGTRSVLSRWLELFANFEDGYFHHTVSIRDNMMATYQGCYATQWYLGFLHNGGAGNPYFLYYHRFDFSTPLSEEADILSFTLEGKEGTITEATTPGGTSTISVTLPTGTPLTGMTPLLTLSDGAILQAPNLPVTFVAGVPQPFTVLAEDGSTTKSYYVTVTLSSDVQASGAELNIDSIALQNTYQMELSILSKTVTQTETGADILIKLNVVADASALRISASISHNAVSTPALDGEHDIDLSNWTSFTIVSEDGTNTSVYRIKVVPKTQASITEFTLTIDGTVYHGVINNEDNTIKVSNVDDSGLTSTTFAPDNITLGEGTTVCSPAAGLEQDFSEPISYVVSGSQVVSRTYTVSVRNKSGKLISANTTSEPEPPAVTGAKITSFTVLGVAGVIDHSAGTITVTLPFDTDITKVAPVVQVASGATVSPVSGEVVNLANGVVYTVTNGEEIREYTIKVILEKSIADQLWDEVAENNTVTDHQVSYDNSILSKRK